MGDNLVREGSLVAVWTVCGWVETRVLAIPDMDGVTVRGALTGTAYYPWSLVGDTIES